MKEFEGKFKLTCMKCGSENVEIGALHGMMVYIECKDCDNEEEF